LCRVAIARRDFSAGYGLGKIYDASQKEAKHESSKMS